MPRKTVAKTPYNPPELSGITSDFGNLCVVAPAESAPVQGRLHVWAPIPGLATAIGSVQGDNLEITVSAEMYQPGGSVWLRAVVDGKAAEPSDVQFKDGNVEFDGVRSFTFVQPNVSGGQHLVEIQMRSGSQVAIRDRVLTVHSSSLFQGSSRLAVAAAPSGPPIQAPTQYQDVPDLATTISTELPSALSINFSAESWAASGRLMVRALVNGAAVGEVIFAEAGDPQRNGTRSFTFVKSNLPAGEHRVNLQWRAVGGVSRIGDRSVSVSAIHAGSQGVTTSTPANPVTVTQTDWISFSNGITIEIGESISNFAVTASTEVLSNRGRVFLRAMIDGQPMSPSDVTLIQGGSKWRATAHTFIAKNVGRGRHNIQVQIRVDPQTTAKIRRRSVRVITKRRRGPDFVQPFLGMKPAIRRIRLLVIGFDPVRPGHARPSFSLLKKIFEGDTTSFGELVPFQPQVNRGPNLRDWVTENSGGLATIAEIRYVGCQDGAWYVAPPERQGNWYWDNAAFDLMWKDALKAADADVDFHSFDTDKNNRISSDELAVAIVRPQNNTYGTVRGTDALLDGNPTPLSVPLLDLYLSSNPDNRLRGVGLVAHEFCHLIFGALDLYGVCPTISAGLYNIMDDAWSATHLDPFEKMKNGLVQPWAVDLDTQTTVTWALPAVELRQQILLLHKSGRVAREYFLIENRYPGNPVSPNYDKPLNTGAIVVWQIFEDMQLVQSSVVCQGDPRFIRKRAVLSSPNHSFELQWADGTSAGFRISAPIPNAELAQVKIEKL